MGSSFDPEIFTGDIFEEIKLCMLPIKLPVHFDMILGMEFLQNHQVLIDFPNKVFYFSKEIREKVRCLAGSFSKLSLSES